MVIKSLIDMLSSLVLSDDSSASPSPSVTTPSLQSDDPVTKKSTPSSPPIQQQVLLKNAEGRNQRQFNGSKAIVVRRKKGGWSEVLLVETGQVINWRSQHWDNVIPDANFECSAAVVTDDEESSSESVCSSASCLSEGSQEHRHSMGESESSMISVLVSGMVLLSAADNDSGDDPSSSDESSSDHSSDPSSNSDSSSSACSSDGDSYISWFEKQKGDKPRYVLPPPPRGVKQNKSYDDLVNDPDYVPRCERE